jgi:hypothetical protein
MVRLHDRLLLSGPIPHQIIISNWYRRKRGQAMGIAYIGGALAGAIGNKLAPWLVSFMPYRSAIQVLGCRCCSRGPWRSSC